MKNFLITTMAALFLLMGAQESTAQAFVRGRKARRPVATVVVKPAKQRPGRVWVEGHWRVKPRTNRRVWVRGRWRRC